MCYMPPGRLLCLLSGSVQGRRSRIVKSTERQTIGLRRRKSKTEEEEVREFPRKQKSVPAKERENGQEED